MARKSVLVVVAVLIGVSVAVGVAVASAHSHEPDRNKLQFTIKFSPFFLLDLGRPGPSQGDQIVEQRPPSQCERPRGWPRRDRLHDD